MLIYQRYNKYILTWSGRERSSHTNQCLCVPFFIGKIMFEVEKLIKEYQSDISDNVKKDIFDLRDDELYMKVAMIEAQIAYIEDEVPIGCVIVRDGEIIAHTHNQKVKNNDATEHAEMLGIKEASKIVGSWHLDDCDMYVTLEPCMMCTGAIINSRIRKVYYATKDPKGGSLDSNIKLIDVKGINHYPIIESGIYQEESSNLLKSFFKNKRKKTNR